MSGRRQVVGTLAGLLAAAVAPSAASPAEPANAAEALDGIDRREAVVAARLRAIEAGLASAHPFVAAVLADHARHRQARAALRARLHLPAVAAPPPPPAVDRSLAALRSEAEGVAHAVAEALPLLADDQAVQTLARQLVDASRHLTIVDLWIADEEARRG